MVPLGDAIMTPGSGNYRYKYRLKAVVQSVAFLLLIGGALIWNGLNADATEEELVRRHERRMEVTQTCDELDKIDPEWMCVFYAVGVLYMFLALAICCDEFFVPALEEMSSKRHMNLSMDVAGATLMAAGGSAPELFSSLFGTFQESEIGFGTIIGSAVFNVLFVIAMCSLFAKETLELTWWPLFRDTSFYSLSLVVLTIFVGVNSPEEIEIWEAAVLFCMYILYTLIMWKNGDLYRYLTGKELVYPDDDEDDEPDSSNYNSEMERPAKHKDISANSIQSAADIANLTRAVEAAGGFRWQGTFRAGILKLLRDPHSWVETGGVGIVAKIAGDADYVFQQIDENGDGNIDRSELKKLFELLDARMSEAELEEVFKQLDTDGDGVIGEHEFNEWYTSSKELIRSQVHHVFTKLDTDHSGTLDKSEIKNLLAELDPKVTDEDVENALDAMYKEGSREEITFEEFSEWYEKSIIFERQKKAVEEDMEGVWESIKFPEEGGALAWAQYIIVLPLVLVMACTIPDVRRPGWGKWCYVAFILSIAWIGGFSYLMVSWAELIGNTLGIPSVIMGLTVLAAGTSVPDLLSSVIVARRGSGDMAVSSSVGSNIFDILVGLPIPWLLYTIYPGTPSTVVIGSDNLWIWIAILIAMVVFVIVVIHCQGWKLTHALAGMMLVFYLVFLGLAIALELPFETCVDP